MTKIPRSRKPTRTTSFGVSGRQSHDSSAFYDRRLVEVNESEDDIVRDSPVQDRIILGSSEEMRDLPDSCVALMVTSPPYHVGKDYDTDDTFEDYLALLDQIFRESYRVLEPGGRAVVNVANLGRRPYIPLSQIITGLMLDIGFLMRGEIIWRKAKGARGSTAWGSWRSASNPVIRDVHEYCLIFSKGRFKRVREGDSTISREDFLDSTLSVWEFPPERAGRVGHPAPFPVELPRRFIELYTFKGDLVLDPFIGSGTTAVASVHTGRRFIGYEVDAEYVEIARRRVEEATTADRQGVFL